MNFIEDTIFPHGSDSLRKECNIALKTSPRGSKTTFLPIKLQQSIIQAAMYAASAVIDYDYIMGLIARYTNSKNSKQRVTKEQLISLVASSANLIDERDDIREYIDSLDEVNGKTEQEIKEGYEAFKVEKYAKQLASIADKHGITADSLRKFVEQIIE